jgi:ATP-dependent Clp protease ATP-binding subunit ClpB
MQQQIDDRLANLLLAGEIHDGSSVRVDVAEGGVDLIVTPGEGLGETLGESLGDLTL